MTLLLIRERGCLEPRISFLCVANSGINFVIICNLCLDESNSDFQFETPGINKGALNYGGIDE